jgi:hypothetical protein
MLAEIGNKLGSQAVSAALTSFLVSPGDTLKRCPQNFVRKTGVTLVSMAIFSQRTFIHTDILSKYTLIFTILDLYVLMTFITGTPEQG